MSFETPAWLWALVVLPVLALVESRAVQRARRAALSLVGPRPNHALLAQALPGTRRTGVALRLGAIALLVLGAAGPQWGRETVRRARQELEELLGKPVESASSLERTHDGWVVVLDVVELRRIPESTDVLGSYELELDESLNFRRYQQVRRYTRSQANRGEE